MFMYSHGHVNMDTHICTVYSLVLESIWKKHLTYIPAHVHKYVSVWLCVWQLNCFPDSFIAWIARGKQDVTLSTRSAKVSGLDLWSDKALLHVFLRTYCLAGTPKQCRSKEIHSKITLCAGFSSQTKTGLPMSAHPVEEALERFLDVQPWPCRLKQIHKN